MVGIFTAALASVSSRNWTNLRALVSNPRLGTGTRTGHCQYRGDGSVQAVWLIRLGLTHPRPRRDPEQGLHGGPAGLHAAPNGEALHASSGDRLHHVLRPTFVDLIPDQPTYDLEFDRTEEVMLATLAQDQANTGWAANPERWPVSRTYSYWLGRSTWRAAHSYGNPVEELSEELATQGALWGPYKANCSAPINNEQRWRWSRSAKTSRPPCADAGRALLRAQLHVPRRCCCVDGSVHSPLRSWAWTGANAARPQRSEDTRQPGRQSRPLDNSLQSDSAPRLQLDRSSKLGEGRRGWPFSPLTPEASQQRPSPQDSMPTNNCGGTVPAYCEEQSSQRPQVRQQGWHDVPCDSRANRRRHILDEDWGPLIQLICTVLLAAVTAWLTWLTKRMADAGRDAARHAQTAAEASLASVAATQASADVTFSVAPALSSTAGAVSRTLLEQTVSEDRHKKDDLVTIDMLLPAMKVSSLSVTTRGATVYIHGVRLDHVTHPDAEKSHVVRTEHSETDLSTSDALPRRFHRGEGLSFDVPDGFIRPDVVRIAATILYSFDGGDRHGRPKCRMVQNRHLRTTQTGRAPRAI